MPKQRSRRIRTGNHRRDATRYIQEQYRHCRALNALQIRLRDAYQTRIMECIRVRQKIGSRMSMLLSLASVATCAIHLQMIYNHIALLREFELNGLRQIENYYIFQEFLLCDIDPNEEEPHEYGIPRNRSFNDWDEYNCDHFTRFSKSELEQIYYEFNFPREIKIHNADNKFYTFSGEEIFLFCVTKLATGYSNIDLCIQQFGGAPQRWSKAYKWFCYRTYDRYKDVIGIQGLQRFTHRFRKYARAIARKFNEYRYLIDNDTGTYIHVESTTVQINRFNICGFIDGSVWETFTPGSGPHGDYNGTMRRNDWYVTQRSVYSGYRKLHGLH